MVTVVPPPSGPVWVTNCNGPFAEKTRREYGKSWAGYDFSIGPPRASFLFTTEELQSHDVAGIYAQPKHID